MKFEAVKADVIEKAFQKSLFALKEQAKEDCNYYARHWQGTLIDTSSASCNGNTLTISWDTPYAKRVYYTGNPSKQVNPNASLMWAEKAQQAFGNDWIAILAKGMADNL